MELITLLQAPKLLFLNIKPALVQMELKLNRFYQQTVVVYGTIYYDLAEITVLR